ncbi:MAG: aminotransferase class V-fold PLP-dependent enzyme [Bacteroidales bacterium]|jgi:selenocysteine lyase/cysteine desulfurase|nr:aminotransferase class V-fold PLP-dependent enzyme [Bacteroidales bacterium]MDD3700295.1 aminotransferase class V-fold PLP-dependent enzyme [Bacteroidales bacterium]MDY0368525.1 aminotransferase class V-fold PLP-dependent enzyme [Bacteroidales bacterium]
MTELSRHFQFFRKGIIGHDLVYQSPYGAQQLMYADWIASGRLYGPIENQISQIIGPYVANTHTETSETGTLMTHAYHHAHKLIKEHVNAGPNDVIITAGTGMTTVINKMQRIMGLKNCRMLNRGDKCQQTSERPVVFITHMEHHSNQTSWFETNVDLVVLQPDDDLLVDPEELRKQLEKYKDRPFKIGSFTACSNVTGIETPIYELAKIMHEYGGIIFVDFAASAPYVDIDMHPKDDEMKKLDAIFFSPHKFLGGPGSSGVMIFDSSLYDSPTPDISGGGTVDWTNPWGEYKYIDDIEIREDGGTPGFLQAIRTALAIDLKNQMNTSLIRQREQEMIDMAFKGLRQIKGLRILADNVEERLGVLSFYLEDIHFNLVVKLLSDRFGIQVRGGCACAGTYGHFLLDVSYERSKKITELINFGDLSEKPGWIRASFHPTTTDQEIHHLIHAVEEINIHHKKWSEDYVYDKYKNEFRHTYDPADKFSKIHSWFKLHSS